MGDLIRQTARERAQLILFPEVFIPGYLRGLIFGTTVGSRTPEGRELFLRYWQNSMEVPGPETKQLAAWAKEAGAWVVTGVTERDQVSDTLYCALLYFSPDGQLARKHRKLKPTAAERIVWGEGDGRDLHVVDTPFGKLGGLICWENYMPLARMALYQQGIDVYVALRPRWCSLLGRTTAMARGLELFVIPVCLRLVQVVGINVRSIQSVVRQLSENRLTRKGPMLM